MRRYFIYLSVALFAFLAGSVAFYLGANADVELIEDPKIVYLNAVNKTIGELEAENKGFDELSAAVDGAFFTLQGELDAKFLCPDVTDSQPGVCTTVLMGGGDWRQKSLVIRLATCGENKKSNCIEWKPDNRCGADGEACANIIRLYDADSRPTDMMRHFRDEKGRKIYQYYGAKLKVTGRVSIVEGKYCAKNPIEKIEIVHPR